MRVARRNNNLTNITWSRHVIARVQTDVNQTIVAGAACDAVGSFVLAALSLRKHDLDGPPNLSLVLLPGNIVDELNESLVTLLDDRLGNLICHDTSRGVRTDGVLECECCREFRLCNNSHRLGEILIGLTRKPDDNVGGDSSVRDSLAHPIKDAQELCGPIRAAHPTQHLIGTRLQRHMQAWHDVRSLSHGLDDVVSKSRRMRGGEPHPL